MCIMYILVHWRYSVHSTTTPSELLTVSNKVQTTEKWVKLDNTFQASCNIACSQRVWCFLCSRLQHIIYYISVNGVWSTVMIILQSSLSTSTLWKISFAALLASISSNWEGDIGTSPELWLVVYCVHYLWLCTW